VSVRANLVVYQSSEEGVSGLYMVARYNGLLRSSGDSWLIKSMDVVVDSFGIDTMLAVPL
jgi:3-phenylpropionate/cinnamic acid dioxygenase small subunit